MFVSFVVIEIYTALQPEEEPEEAEDEELTWQLCQNVNYMYYMIFFQISLAFNIFPTLVLV